MNNSKFAVDSVPLTLDRIQDIKPQLREREAKLVRVIAALQTISKTKEWSSLKTELLDGLTERLTKDLLTESKRESPDTLKLARLAGQLKWAERYSDLSVLEQEFKLELTQVKSLLYGTTQTTG